MEVNTFDDNLLFLKYPKVKRFLKLVLDKTKGYDVYLGGGFLRDILHRKGLTPKDVDLFFVPNGVTQKELPIIPKGYVNYDIDADSILHCRNNVTRVVGWFASDIEVRDVQFIVYKEPLTVEELVNDMDCNINQIMMPLEGNTSDIMSAKNVYRSPAFIVGHQEQRIEMLHQFEEKRMVDRLKRMAVKFPNYEIIHNMDESVWEKYKREVQLDDTDDIRTKVLRVRNRVRSSSSPSFVD